MKQVAFEGCAFHDFNEWAISDKKIYQKIIALIKDIDRNPFVGIGKPEALKHDFSSYWSRRINDEHRLVYKMTETSIVIASCKYHYEK